MDNVSSPTRKPKQQIDLETKMKDELNKALLEKKKQILELDKQKLQLSRNQLT